MWCWRCWYCAAALFFCSFHLIFSQDCSPASNLRVYEPIPLPISDPFTNNTTLGPGCFKDFSTSIWECFPNNPLPVLIDGQLGEVQSPPNVSAIHAWSRSQQTVTIAFRYSSSTQVRHIRLYFYHVPSMGIGLPDIAITAAGTSQSYYVTDNQDLNSTDAHRRMVLLSFTNTLVVSTRYEIQFTFETSSKVDWLLLSEVEMCTLPNTVVTPTVAPELVSTVPVVRSSDNVSPNLTLSCTVSGEGRFRWEWTGPQNPETVWFSDFTRTSTAEFTGIRGLTSVDTGYSCRATYDPTIAGRSFAMSVSRDFDVTLDFTITSMTTSVIVLMGDTVTLSCEGSGYLPGPIPDFMWLRRSNMQLNNGSIYTITTMDGNGFLQNGGSSPVPSIVSQLSFVANTSMANEPFSCQFQGRPLFFFVTTTTSFTSDATSTDIKTSASTMGSAAPSLPSTSINTSVVIIAGVIGSFVVVILVVFIALVVIVILRKKHTQHKLMLPQAHRKDSLDYQGEPVYQDVPQPLPPPIPTRFPGQNPELEMYASIDNKPNGYFEMSEKNKKTSLQRSVLSSTGSSNNEKLPFLERNPIYDSSDQLDDNRGRSMSKSPKSWTNSQNDDCELNIYARPSHVKPPPVPHRLPTPELMDESIYSEADFKPALFASSRVSSVSAASESRELPCISIYDDPEPLIRSEGPKEIFPGNVHEIKELGVGQFGQVILAKTVGLSLKDLQIDSSDDKNISIFVAVKKLKNSAESHVKEAFEKEIKFMSRLRNKNVIRLLAICPSSNPFIVMEYMPNGDLNQFLQNRKLAAKGVKSDIDTTLNRSDLVHICLQIASGMKYLATFKFIHRDLATRNCLVGDNLAIKIADFGMSRSLYSSYYYRISGRAMLPIRWMANECFYGKFSEKTDVWAFAVTMWEVFVFAREQPYDEMTDQEVIDDAIKGPDRKLLPRPDCCPVEVYEVMKRCWVDEPTERTKFNEVHSLLEAIYEYGTFDE